MLDFLVYLLHNKQLFPLLCIISYCVLPSVALSLPAGLVWPEL